MGLQFIKKKFRKSPRIVMCQSEKNVVEKEKIDNNEIVKNDNIVSQNDTVIINNSCEEPKNKKNNKKNKENMFDKDKIAEIEAAVKKMEPEVKVVKTDRGLIERTESSKIIITEDNRQVLID